jgi:hypothetical protein
MPLDCICPCGDTEKIVSLVPSGGAITQVKGTWFTSVRAAHDVTVTVVTDPNTADVWANVRWQNAVGGGGQAATVARTPLGPVRVTASLDNSKSVDLHFVELRTLVSTTGTATVAGTWKCWRQAGGFAEVLATPDPDWYFYRNLFTWAWQDAGAAAGNNQGVAGASARRRRIPLDDAGDVITVTATLYEQSKTITIRVCQPPVLQLQRLTFDGHVVACDDRGDFDRIWEHGRPEADPAVAAVANPAGAVNSVLCFTGNGRITITARLQVTTAPTDPENVTIRGTATIGGRRLRWEHAGLAVNPADATVTTNAMASDAAIPAQVGRYENVAIAWVMVGPDGRTTDLGSTRHLVYATLAARGAPLALNGTPDPVPPYYWTLLEISCRAAHGATTEAQLVSRTFGALKTTTGDGNGPRRARDNQRLSYWLQGINSAGVFNTRALLNAGDGGGRCGSWARLFCDMLALHGAVARLVKMVPAQDPVANHRFLVKNCTFTGAGNAAQAPFTHVGHQTAGNGRCSKAVGAPGQGNTNPTFLFGDHAIVVYGGQFYDPSYGIGPYATLLAWEKAAIDGLGDANHGTTTFLQSGITLRITNRCSPGFREHTIGLAENLDTVAALYGTTAASLWSHAYNHALRLANLNDITAVAAGQVVVVPRQGTRAAMLRRE